jgi:hypothetical protein
MRNVLTILKIIAAGGLLSSPALASIQLDNGTYRTVNGGVPVVGINSVKWSCEVKLGDAETHMFEGKSDQMLLDHFALKEDSGEGAVEIEKQFFDFKSGHHTTLVELKNRGRFEVIHTIRTPNIEQQTALILTYKLVSGSSGFGQLSLSKSGQPLGVWDCNIDYLPLEAGT